MELICTADEKAKHDVPCAETFGYPERFDRPTAKIPISKRGMAESLEYLSAFIIPITLHLFPPPEEDLDLDQLLLETSWWGSGAPTTPIEKVSRSKDISKPRHLHNG